jgi:uncharacterized membrane protein
MEDGALHIEPAVVKQLTAVVQKAAMSYTGPLPPPNWLEKYDQVLPGMANRLVVMLENETSHRHAFEKELLSKDYDLKGRGQTLGMGALILILGIIAFMVWSGHPWPAVSLGTATLVGVVAVFVLGKRTVVDSNGDTNDSGEAPTLPEN